MHILKIHNTTGTYYFGREKAFNALHLVTDFTKTKNATVIIENGMFKTDSCIEFCNYIIKEEEFIQMKFESVTVITMRKN
jgi:hypothetical protein